MTDFEEKLEDLFVGISREYGKEVAKAYIAQIKLLLAEVVGEARYFDNGFGNKKYTSVDEYESNLIEKLGLKGGGE